MTSGDILNYSLALGFLVFVGFSCYAIYHFVQVLKTTITLLENVENLTEDLGEGIKNNPVVRFLGIFKKKSRESED